VRTFTLNRLKDISGVSGTGIVAEGVEFSNGTCVLNWLTLRGSIAIYKTIEDLTAIHGHDGHTQIEWEEEAISLCKCREYH
jgi:hypothetical protein